MKKMCIISIVIDALVVVPKGFEGHMHRLGLGIRLEMIQKTILLVMVTCCYVLPSKIFKKISV